MEALTPAERRGALVVVLLLVLGAGHDLWRASRPLPATGTGASPVGDPSARSPADPGPGETIAREPAGSRLEARRAGRPIDLNRASARELDALPGIGPVLAARIVSHRERHGPFRTSEELLAVRGIGPRLFARLRPGVIAGPEPTRAARPPADSLAGPH